MFSWVRKGLRTGIVTTRYPARPEPMPPQFRGRPVLDGARCVADQGCHACVTACLPGAFNLTPATTHGRTAQSEAAAQLTLDAGRCIMCGMCVTACPAEALHMTPEYELATTTLADLRQTTRFLSAEEPAQQEENHGDTI